MASPSRCMKRVGFENEPSGNCATIGDVLTTSKHTVIVNGSGTILFRTKNTYTGPTTISTGMLIIGLDVAGGLSAESAVSVNNDGELLLENITGGKFANDVSNGVGSSPPRMSRCSFQIAMPDCDYLFGRRRQIYQTRQSRWCSSRWGWCPPKVLA